MKCGWAYGLPIETLITATPSDRIRQAYDEFKPLDGQFHENVLILAKNGPLDFQPREPFHPLFGGMTETPVALELQVLTGQKYVTTTRAQLRAVTKPGDQNLFQ